MPLALTGYELGVLVVACVFIVFALVVALVVPRTRPEFPARRLGLFIAVAIGLFVAQMTAVLLMAELGEAEEGVAHEGGSPEPEPTEPGPTEPSSTEPAPTDTSPTEPPPTDTGTGDEPTETTVTTDTTETTDGAGAGGADPVDGKEIFLANCGTCHTLSDAGTTGTIGPNLDDASPSADKVVERVTNGQGAMPSFKDTLTEQQIQNVAAYVSSAVEG